VSKVNEEQRKFPRLPAKEEWKSLHRQAEDVLGEEFWQDIAGLVPNRGPRIDIYYTPAAVVVLAEIPALTSPEQIGIRLEGQTLVLEGDIPRPYPVTESRITLRERFFGSFGRRLQMPKPVSREGIQARYAQGLLTIELRVEEPEPLPAIPIEFS